MSESKRPVSACQTTLAQNNESNFHETGGHSFTIAWIMTNTLKEVFFKSFSFQLNTKAAGKVVYLECA